MIIESIRCTKLKTRKRARLIPESGVARVEAFSLISFEIHFNIPNDASKNVLEFLGVPTTFQKRPKIVFPILFPVRIDRKHLIVKIESIKWHEVISWHWCAFWSLEESEDIPILRYSILPQH